MPEPRLEHIPRLLPPGSLVHTLLTALAVVALIVVAAATVFYVLAVVGFRREVGYHYG